MRKFKWIRHEDYGRQGPISYLSDKQEILQHKQFMFARISARHLGPNSAYALVFQTVEWPTPPEQHWYSSINRHFKGRNADRQAKAWCNFLLNNPPWTYTSGNGHIDQWDYNRQEATDAPSPR